MNTSVRSIAAGISIISLALFWQSGILGEIFSGTPFLVGACTETRDPMYPQCGRTVGLEDFPASHTIEVTPVKDCNGNIVRFEKVDKGAKPGECGNAALSGQPPANAAPCSANFSLCAAEDNKTFCEDTGPNMSTIFLKRNASCDPANSLRDSNGCIFTFESVSFQNHSCAGVPQPTQAPVVQTVTTCDSRTITVIQLENEVRVAGFPGPFDVGSMLAAFNRAACPAAQPTQPPVQIVQIPVQVQPTQPVQVQPTQPVQIVQIPAQGNVNVRNDNDNDNVNVNDNRSSSSSNSSSNNTINLNQSSNQTVNLPQVVIPAQQRVVVAAAGPVAVSQLPKTGLPAAAWVLSGLLPAGLGLRRFAGRGEGQKQTDSAQFICQQREYEKDHPAY